MFPTTIGVGVDGSPTSGRAIEAAVELAELSRSELHLIHVRSSSRGLHGRTPTAGQRERSSDEGERILAAAAGQVEDLGGTVAGRHLRSGAHLAATLATAAAELELGLLVVGDGRSGRLTDLLGTGGAATTLRRTPGSVLVVR